MENSKLLDLIFTQWSASLKSRDRSSNSVRPNFEDLFQKWKSAGITFDELYESPNGISPLQKAIKAHQPVDSVARKSYKKFKQIIKEFDKTYKEFIDEWNKSIEDTATETFFEFFPPPKLDDDNEPKVFGNMSAKEYRAQRRYAEQFPVLNTEELEKRWHEKQYNLDVEDLIKNVLGDEE